MLPPFLLLGCGSGGAFEIQHEPGMLFSKMVVGAVWCELVSL
jgi:hypothetical protein